MIKRDASIAVSKIHERRREFSARLIEPQLPNEVYYMPPLAGFFTYRNRGSLGSWFLV